MVVNISQVLSGHFDYVQDEIKQIVDLAHDSGAKVKVIFENCYLNREQKIALCEICTEVRADWVKTSTGYGTGGFTFEDIDLMLKNVGKHVQVKAAGGVRDLDTLLKLRTMGVTRCGASRTAVMLDECRRRLEMPAVAS
jgi:deoxyribose-phosphate aldolase